MKIIKKAISLVLVQLLIAAVLSTGAAAADKKPGNGGIDVFDGPTADNSVVITYECCDSCGYKKESVYSANDEIYADFKGYCKKEGEAFVCWTDENGNEYYGGDELPAVSVTLKAKRTPLLLAGNEVLSFSNSDPYFYTDEFSGYYMNEKDTGMMYRNINKVFLPASPISVALSVAFSTYPGWYWGGSCYGMSTFVFLQHYGQKDFLKDSGAASVSELTNTADVVSKINYYQWSASGSFLCENFSTDQGTKMYAQQIKDVYDRVAEGNIVLFTYYYKNILESSGHTVLLTGAYTQPDGTRVLIAYDCNNPADYMSGAYEQRFYVSPDCSSVIRSYTIPAAYSRLDVGSFNWTDNYRQFEAFDIDGEGKAITWYTQFFGQLENYFRTLIKIAF